MDLDHAVKVLNEFLTLDPGGCQNFLNFTVTVNEGVLNHPSIQVFGLSGRRVVSTLGLINGLLSDPDRVIVCCTDDINGRIIRFEAGSIKDGVVILDGARGTANG